MVVVDNRSIMFSSSSYTNRGGAMPKRAIIGCVLALMTIQTGLLIHSAKVHSPTWDEVGHLAAGLSHWELGRFELYSVNPPLVRTIVDGNR